MSVHYKFKSALEYDTITFDGLHISVKDLKNSIIQQKRIGKSTDFDLQVTNAQTKEVYEDENALIPKNTSLLIARVPNAAQSKPKQWEGYGGDSSPTLKSDDGGPIAKAADLSSLDAPEDDKIKAMISQSTQDYDPSNYQKIRGSNQMGVVPPTYRCYKCHQTGHWIKDCTFGLGTDAVEIKKSTGIPQSFMVPVDGPQVPGAMMTPNGSYAVPVLDHEAYNLKPVPAPIIEEDKPEIPEDLICSICSDLLTDAVMIPCCGNSFCDECIRFFLLETEDHECPDCHEKDICPVTLIPNRFLRKSVSNFKNTTGYVKKQISRPPTKKPEVDLSKPLEAKQEIKKDTDEKTVISEADSTENSKNKQIDKVDDNIDSKKTADVSESEHPKDVSLDDSSPKGSEIKRLEGNRSDGNKNKKMEDSSPRNKLSNSGRSPQSYGDRNEDRPGTPTVDEPGIGSNNYQYSGPPQAGLATMMSMTNVQGPPPNIASSYSTQPLVSTFPPTSGPPPNFRLPPPGNVPYMPSGPYVNPPPRPMFDPNRPPMSGPPPYNPAGSGYPLRPIPPHHNREFDRRIRNRTPPGIIDDPLAAFNRMIREKDERERRAKQRMMRRSYSRSRSRSRSYSPRSPRRIRSRSPRRRSRSRSFSMSRSRSRSYSGSMRGTSPHSYRDRDYSPRHSPRRGPPPPRYRSPARSSPRRYKDSHSSDRRDRNEYDREYRRDDREYTTRDTVRRERDRGDRERDYRNYDSFDDRYRPPNKSGQWNNHSVGMRGPPEAYYNPPPPEITQSVYQQPSSNRYPTTRDYPPPTYMGKPDPTMMAAHQMTPRKYEDVPPPGVEEPPVPGLENSPHLSEKPIIDPIEPLVETKGKDERRAKNYKDLDKYHRGDRADRGRERHRNDKDSKRDNRKDKESDSKRRSTPTRKGNSTHERETPEKRKRKHESSDREKSDKDKKKEYSDDEKSKKTKDKKRKREREKKDKDKKKRDKKEKHKEKDKDRDKKHKEESKDKDHNKNENTAEDKKEKIESSQLREEITNNQMQLDSPKKQDNVDEEPKHTGLYDDIIDENMDKEVKELYEEPSQDNDFNIYHQETLKVSVDEKELEQTRDFEDERDILELHSNDIDLKTELEVKNEMLAPLPEKSKWEDDDENLGEFSPMEMKGDLKNAKLGTVSSEVLKRAENAIFAKAINAIRPIEIKKLSADRVKFYSGEKEEIVETFEKKIELNVQPVKIPVKDRLGIKVNEPDTVIKLDRASPFSRRIAERNYGIDERRIEDDRSRSDRNKDDKNSRNIKSRDRRDKSYRKDNIHRRDEKPIRSRSKTKSRDIDRTKRSRTESGSDDHKDKKRKKDRKHKEKSKKKEEKQNDEKPDITKLSIEKRKPTLDEASFEPDYDLESETEEKKGDSSSSDSDSSSSSEEERKKKKRKKNKKKKHKKDSSSSSSESDTDSSDDEKERKKKKHKKNKKKKKKTKHK